jgi:DNA-3-methyladenine glycosylase II
MTPVQQIRRDARTLVRRDPRLASNGVPLGVEVWGGGYGGLVRLILGQLVSIEAADAMWANLTAALGSVTPETIAGADPDTLRRCGFTAQKAAHARTIGEAGVDFTALDAATDAEIIGRLIRLPGIGVWTAECYLLFCLGRRDVFPAGDLALRIGWAEIAGLDAPPPEAALRQTAAQWAPHRTAAAYLVWARYLRTRGRVNHSSQLTAHSSHAPHFPFPGAGSPEATAQTGDRRCDDQARIVDEDPNGPAHRQIGVHTRLRRVNQRRRG